LLAVLNQPFELCGESLRPGGSVGIGLYPDHGSDFATLLRAADKALYAAKEQGRGRTCCCADAGLPPRAPSLAGARLGRH
jgi:GGDEF domain-containing protein